MSEAVQITLNIPAWALWCVAAVLAVSAAVNVWHGIELRRYLRARQEERTDV